MSIQTILLLLGAAILALGFAIFQYGGRSKKETNKNIGLPVLRFLSVFLLLVLLINPKFKKQTYYTEKPTLILGVDNSSSVGYLQQEQKVRDVVQMLRSDQELNKRFEIATYTFGENLKDTTGFTFRDTQTNIANTLRELDQIYGQNVAPTLLITDGNQTYGVDYQYSSKEYNQQLYPIILGDTIRHTDLKLRQLNVNKYAYLKNQFPVEAIVTYNGTKSVESKFIITNGGTTIFSKTIAFSPSENSKVITAQLPARTAGIQTYRAAIVPINEEKNKENNQKQFAVEVIDQKTNVLVVSTLVHPDIGVLKRSVERDERSAVTIKKPSEIKDLESYQLVVLYQPDTSFKNVYEKLKISSKNYFTITGTKTNWSYLNSAQSSFFYDYTRQKENFLAALNRNYTTFLLDDIDFESYPPLEGVFGDVTMITAHQVIAYQKIGAITTGNPLLATMETGTRREGVLFGEGLWKWRAQEYVENNSFKRFDDFFGKILQYLASNKKKQRLEVKSESFYYGNSGVRIQAAYFTKNYEFDRRGHLNVTVKNIETAVSKVVPFVLKNTNYEVDLSNFPAGKYEYTVTVAEEKLANSGNFTILDFDIEKQFLNADVTKLRQAATNTDGKAFFSSQLNDLTKQLLTDKRYQPIQKKQEATVSLIDWKYLLGMLILILTIEWFMRKYNGLI